jgi:hypothetical protein
MKCSARAPLGLLQLLLLGAEVAGAYGQQLWPGASRAQWPSPLASLSQPAAQPLALEQAAAEFGSQSDAPPQCECPPEEDESVCRISSLKVSQEHLSTSGLSFTDIATLYGGRSLTTAQRHQVVLADVSKTSLMCLDDRVVKPSLVTPGGDLGEFILALAAYLGQRSSSPSDLPSQEAVDRYLRMYLETVPAERPMIHCTDDRALRQLEDTLPAEGLDLRNPSGTVKRPDLLLALTKPENHGDLHIRLMLKQPEWYQLNAKLVPMVLRSFYGQLWQQNPKVDLRVLTGVSNPQAFFEVSSSPNCQEKGIAPMLTPRESGHSVLISHLDAVSLRRKDLAEFFARIANATPRKVDKEQLHQRLDRHGWLALETTGSRIASGLPFYTLTYE